MSLPSAGFVRSILEIDHINRDKTDNRITNLRVVTASENCRNRSKPRGCYSEFVGVTWNKNCKKWQASLVSGGRLIHIGTFSTEQDAASARAKFVARAA